MWPPLFLCRVCCTTNHLLLAWDREERWWRGWAGSSKERHPRVRWVKGQGNGHLRDQGFLLPSLPPTFALTRLITCLPCWDMGCQCTFCVDFTRYRNFARETCWLLLRMVGSWCALTFHSRKYHRSLDFPPLVAAKGHKAYSVLKQEWGPVHSHTVVQHCLLSSCTELPLKSIQDAYGTFLERDINQKYIHSRGVCVYVNVCICVCVYVCLCFSLFFYIYIFIFIHIYIYKKIIYMYAKIEGGGKKVTSTAFSLRAQCEWPVRTFLWWTVNIRPLFHVGLGNQMWRQLKSLSSVWESWLCVYLQYTLWCMWNPPYTCAHTHTHPWKRVCTSMWIYII